ncbi:PREDICTED: probable rRNA-processing protein EBP2 homolog [Ceratosolen solmsi marchali]|uniref:Probable rRNA-processing protein EBP2 homolog n=1 Tax=Ceratosolen solmsi marchali TaxID=326594 RepID=A0AAJ6YD20_9HYME|nr:PREDICTED: probable rRNA-processing protein EBP2 homolog [Ceratosolen solmsi marchali]
MSSESGSEYDSLDEDLQEAFSKGVIKPGLNVAQEDKKVLKNNIRGLNKKLEEFRQKLPWIEKLILINAPAPMAPELALQMQEQESRRDRQLRGNKKLPQYDSSDDPVLNDFRRETLFHRQAQSAVVEGIARLKSLNVPTLRPEDYYAEMAKTDEHMQKVKTNLIKKQTQAQYSEKVRQMRVQRKISKQMQIEATLKKHAEKKKLLEEVKKYRKGIRQDLDFLEDKKKSGLKQKPNNNMSKRALEKRNMKNSKFGFGGKKRGMKKNTRDSAADVSDYRPPGKPGKMGKFKNKSGRLGKGKINSRPGKSRRVQMKAKRK